MSVEIDFIHIHTLFFTQVLPTIYGQIPDAAEARKSYCGFLHENFNFGNTSWADYSKNRRDFNFAEKDKWFAYVQTTVDNKDNFSTQQGRKSTLIDRGCLNRAEHAVPEQTAEKDNFAGCSEQESWSILIDRK